MQELLWNMRRGNRGWCILVRPKYLVMSTRESKRRRCTELLEFFSSCAIFLFFCFSCSRCCLRSTALRSYSCCIWRSSCCRQWSSWVVCCHSSFISCKTMNLAINSSFNIRISRRRLCIFLWRHGDCWWNVFFLADCSELIREWEGASLWLVKKNWKEEIKKKSKGQWLAFYSGLIWLLFNCLLENHSQAYCP